MNGRPLRRLLVNSGWMMGAESLGLLGRLISGFVIARLLGVTRFGQWALITAFVTVLGQVLDFRAWETAIRYVLKFGGAGERTRAGATIKLCLLLDVGSAAVACLCAVLLARLGAEVFVGDPQAAPLIRVLALGTLFVSPAATSVALLRAADLFRALALRSTISAVVRTAAIITAAVLGYGLRELVELQVALAAFDLVVAAVMARQAVRKLGLTRWWAAPLTSLRPEWRPLSSFLLFTNLTALLKVLQAQCDVLLVGYFLRGASAGYVQLARSITDAMRFLAGPVNSAAYPEYARLFDEGALDEARRVTRSLLRVTTLVAGAALAVVLVAAPAVVRHLAGEEYLPAVPILTLLAIGTAFEIPSAIFHPALIAAHRTARSMVALGAAVGMRVATLVVLLPWVGAIGAGIAHLTYVLTYVALTSLWTWRALDDRSRRRP